MSIGSIKRHYIPEVSAVLDGSLRDAVAAGLIKGVLVIPLEVVYYFEKEARNGNPIGVLGLEEVKELGSLIQKLDLGSVVKVEVLPIERRPVEREADIESTVRRIAKENNMVLITNNPLTRSFCEASGVECLFLKREKKALELERFFSDEVMSVHLKEGAPPRAKAGRPGSWRMILLDDKPIGRDLLNRFVRELIAEALVGGGARLEISRQHSLIVMYRDYRIVVTFPPLSNGIEVTAVRPLVRKRLEDYGLDPMLVERLERGAEGILIAGPPGAGKTTFAQALAEYYLRTGKIVRTIESPRDMVLPPEITQLSKTYASSEELHDILLLSRPDYTIFDEMRDTNDFQLYIDLRLAGVGMVGVIHATTPIDAVQRFIHRVDLGLLTSIIDTVIYLKDGEVKKAYSLEMTVKVPEGLREEDLARPVVLVRDFLSGEVEYEIYVFGEEKFVVPVRQISRAKALPTSLRKVEKQIVKVLKRYVPVREIRFEPDEEGLVIRVPEEYLNVVLARGLPKLERIRRKYGIRIDVSSL